MGQVFKVKVSVRDFEPGQAVSLEELHAAGCDVPWLVSAGTIEPMTAGQIALRSAGVDPVTLLDEVEDLTNKAEPLVKANGALRDHAEALHATTGAALKMARERGEQLADVVERNGELAVELGVEKGLRANLQKLLDAARDEITVLKTENAALKGECAGLQAQIDAAKAEAPDDAHATAKKKAGK